MKVLRSVRRGVALASLLALSAFSQQVVKIPVYEVPGVVTASALAQQVQSYLDAQVAKQNSGAVDVANAGCRDWTANNLHNRDLGLSLTPKPAQPKAIHVTTKTDGPAGALVLTVTTTSGPDVVGISCPDLPPAIPAQPPKGNVQIGNHNFGLYWAQGPQDNPPDDVFQGKPFQGISMDNVSGMWMFIGSPLSSEIYGRKGWYLKLN